jgi:predicted Zn-dependent protease
VGTAFAELFVGLRGEYRDPVLGAYVTRVGLRVARASERPALPWRFRVTDDPGVAAHALPGGQISLTRGLLAQLGSEAELAAVLAHEIAHVARHHTLAAWSTAAPPLGEERADQELARDRDQERQADALAVGYLEATGYAPGALGVALEALWRGTDSGEPRTDDTRSDEPARGGCTAVHPEPPARRARLALVAAGKRGRWHARPYLMHLDGLPLGDDVESPRIEHGRFVVPGALSFALPAGHAGEVDGAHFESTRGEPRLAIVQLPGALLQRATLSAVRATPHTVRTAAGRRVVLGTLGQEGERSRVGVVQSGRRVFVVAVQEDSARAGALLDAVVASARDAPRVSRRPTLRVRRAVGTGVDLAVWNRTCPSSAPAKLQKLNAPGRLARSALVKCAE